MDSTKMIWLLIAVGVCLLIYVLYTRQFKWVFGVIRNAAIGCLGMAGANFMLSGAGLFVGINALTAFIVGILGLPGFMLLYVTQLIVR